MKVRQKVKWELCPIQKEEVDNYMSRYVRDGKLIFSKMANAKRRVDVELSAYIKSGYIIPQRVMIDLEILSRWRHDSRGTDHESAFEVIFYRVYGISYDKDQLEHRKKLQYIRQRFYAIRQEMENSNIFMAFVHSGRNVVATTVHHKDTRDRVLAYMHIQHRYLLDTIKMAKRLRTGAPALGKRILKRIK